MMVDNPNIRAHIGIIAISLWRHQCVTFGQTSEIVSGKSVRSKKTMLSLSKSWTSANVSLRPYWRTKYTAGNPMNHRFSRQEKIRKVEPLGKRAN